MSGSRLYHQYKDIQGVTHMIEVFTVGYTTDYKIDYGDQLPVSLSQNGHSKNDWDETVIIGRALVFSFYLPRADISVIDPLFESQYKDYQVKYYVNSELVFYGHLKPENLYKRYETNPPYIEIELPATDALADLKKIEFRDFTTGGLVDSNLTMFEIIKKCLEHIELPLDFVVQLNTIEATEMTSVNCALKVVRINTERFYNKDKPADGTVMSCWDVIYSILYPFNLRFKQHRGEYYITNYYERESPAFEIVYDTLLQNQTSDPVDNTIDITDYQFKPYIEQQKIHPLKGVITKFETKDVGGDVTGIDPEDWTLYWDSTFTTSSEGTDGFWYLSAAYSNPLTDHHIQLKADFPITRENDEAYEYILIDFIYKLNSCTYTGSLPKMWLVVQIYKPESGWSATWRTPLDLARIHYQSPAREAFRIYEEGDYNIRISLEVDPSYTNWTGLQVVLESFQIRKRVGNDIVEYNPQGESTEDVAYKQVNIKGYETLELNAMFGDGDSKTKLGAYLIGSLGSEIVTKSWYAYDSSTAIQILDLCARYKLINRSKYKNFIRGTVIDRNHLINEHNIVIIESKDYVFSSFDRDYRNGELEFELVELITDDIDASDTPYDEHEEVEEDLIKVGIIYNGTKEIPEELDGISQPTHNFSIGDVIRYDNVAGEYVKALADSADNAKAVGIVSDIIDNNRFKYINDGYVYKNTALYDSLSLEKGEYYFLSPTVQGTMLKSSSLNTDDIEQCVGYVTTKGLKVQINARNIQPPGVDPYVPRAASQALVEGDNVITYSTAFPAGSTVVVWIYTYDSNGYQVGHSVSNETVTGFTVNVPKNCTLKYIATIEN